MSESRFQKIGGRTESTPWKPMAVEQNGFHFDPKDDENNIMEGYYIERADLTGKDGKSFTVHKVHEVLKDGSLGQVWGVSGGMVLDERMESAPVGSFIQIKYAGRKHKKGIPVTNAFSQTNSFHMWEVGIDKNAIPYNQVAGAKSVTQPANNTPNPVNATSAGTANTTSTGTSTAQATQKFNSRSAATQTGNAGNQVANSGQAVEEDELPF